MASLNFSDRYGPWAVIAGASEGIGQAYAHALAARGLNLVTLARRRDVLEDDAAILRTRYGVQVKTVALDLAAEDLRERFLAAIDGLDVGLLIYNACFSKIADFVDTAPDDHQRTLDVNCRGPLILVHALLPQLVRRGRGGILLMSSMSGFQGAAMVTSYSASKAFNTVLAEGLWAELQHQGIDILACVAGATSTPGFERSTPEANRAKPFPMPPEAVAREGLAALGRGPVHIAGRLNRFVNAFSRLMTRRQRASFFSKATRDIYDVPGARP